MKSYPIYHVDAFASRPFAGNPAGVVLDARDLSPDRMQQIAAELKYSETAFVLPSDRADYRVRFFTPAREVDLCGHASIATAWVLAREGRIELGRNRQETNVGILDLNIGRERVMMELAPPKRESVETKTEDLAAILGLKTVDTTLPLQKVFAGLWILLVPMLDERRVNLCRPNLGELAALNVELGVSGTYVFARDPGGALYARFFGPAVGVPEDPVTGTAAGALGGYLVLNGIAPGPEFRVRQGDSLGRPGEVEVHATENDLRVGGHAVILSRGQLTF